MGHRIRLAAMAIAGLLLSAQAGTAQTLTLAATAPGSPAQLFASTLASIVNSGQDQIQIQVEARRSTARHLADLTDGRVDMCVTTPGAYAALKAGQTVAADPNAEDVRLLLWFPAGALHVIARAGDGLTRLSDIAGRTVFTGPPGSDERRAAEGWIRAQTDLVAGIDYTVYAGSWSSAVQAFRDRRVDVYVAEGIAPFPPVEQLAATGKLTILGPTKVEVDRQPDARLAPARAKGASLDRIPVSAYADKVSNTQDVYSLGSVAGIAVRADLPEDQAYRIVVAFWEGTLKMRHEAPWLNNLSLRYAIQDGGLTLHAGAARYYRELGLNLPQGSRPY